MDILVSGFQPFLQEEMNPSEKIVRHLASNEPNLRTVILPVEFKRSFDVLSAELIQKKPDYLIMLGQAAGRKNICFEKVALNWVQTEHKDEGGHLPNTGEINELAPPALMTQFPIEIIFEKLKNQNLPVEISFSAGTFVCNDLYFRTLQEFPDLKAIFIHIPLITEQLKENDERPALPFFQELQIIKSILQLLRELG